MEIPFIILTGRTLLFFPATNIAFDSKYWGDGRRRLMCSNLLKKKGEIGGGVGGGGKEVFFREGRLDFFLPYPPPIPRSSLVRLAY